MIGIYTRLSVEDEESNSLDNQLREGKKFANTLPYEHYNEGMGVSGRSEIDSRPQLDRLPKDIATGKITTVWMRNQNRLERNSMTFHIFASLVKKHKTRVFFGDKETDWNDPSNFLQSSILTAINSYQAELQSYQTKKSLKDNAREGKAHGILPYGYKADDKGYMVVNEQEAETVRQIFKMSMSGKGTKAIAETVNKEGIPTRYNSYGGSYLGSKYKDVRQKKDVVWRDGTIYTILINPVYKGVRKFGGNNYKSPIIIDPHKWEAVQNNLKQNTNNRGKKVEHKYMLKGLITCGRCGKNFYGRARASKKDNAYICSSRRYKEENCGNRGINITHLESFLWNRFFKDAHLIQLVQDHLKNDDVQIQISGLESDLNNFDTQLAKLSKERQNAIRMAVKGLLGEEDIQPEIKRIEKEVQDIELKKIRTQEQLIFLKGSAQKEKDIEKDINKIKDRTDFNTKKEIIHKYIKGIEVEALDNDKCYRISFDFNLPIAGEKYIMPYNYNYALETKKAVLIPILGKGTKEEVDKVERMLNQINRKIAKIDVYL